ncbi:MAG: hypothetical protein Q4D90_07755 [bacterium]|nr:hypothetical protein [bacterium]
MLPILGEALRFFHGYLQRESDGSLVSGPSVSPENVYCLPDGQQASVSMGPTMDHQIIRELAENYLEGCHLYGKTEDCEEVLGFAREIAEKLPKTAVGADGRILEWRRDYQEAELGHRHISHLYGLYPGREICEENPSLWEGAKKTLECRLQHGGGHTGWSRAWIQCFYARLKEAEKLDEQLRLFFENSVAENLWDVHPPFQIDGNFGMAAAVLEALAVRRGDRVELLPALPSAFSKGRVKGQRLKGRLVLDYAWEEGQLSDVSLYSGKEQTLRLCYSTGSQSLHIKAGEKVELCFKAKKA